MAIKIHESWKEILNDEFSKPYFQNLIHFVKAEYQSTTCFPPGKKIFAAFDFCPWEKLKVVIIGQDPYHGLGQANGLCFSVNNGIGFPPSLINIFKELQTDIGKPIPESGDLSHWAEQGVLLLNATLTVRSGLAGSHQGKGWEEFTNQVIKKISDEKENIVFLLWGGFARGKVKLINRNRHYILESGHPSPLSANRGYWFGNRHFSKCNNYLSQKEIELISW